jgi:hypothetical protein
MPPLLTADAVILCSHGGRVAAVPSQTTVLAAGAPVLCLSDLMGAPVIGCTLAPTPATKPCTATVMPLPGSWSMKVSVAGRPALTAMARGMTDAVPPGTFQVVFPGQMIAEG